MEVPFAVMDYGEIDLCANTDGPDRGKSGGWLAKVAQNDLRRRLPEPELNDADWERVNVPGHWRSEPAFAHADGPIFYRRHFEAAATPRGARSWLNFAGMFYQGDVWLDGAYIGDTEGYFSPHSFEITQRLGERSEHLLAVELACTPAQDRRSKRNLTGIFEHWDCIDPSWNPGGIWAPVTINRTGPVRIATLRVLCREANAERATLDFEAELDSLEATTVWVSTAVETDHDKAATVAERRTEERLAAGLNRVRWRVAIERPALWWPHALGGQALHAVTVSVEGPAGRSDRRSVVTGLRQVRMSNFVASINGERLFLKGANCGPTRRELAEATPDELTGDISVARNAGLDLLRVHAHITRPEFYEAADRAGMLLWQDLPLQWGYGHVRHQATRQARAAVTLLGHHPCIAVWCGHNEPLTVDLAPGAEPDRATVRRFVVQQMLPTWNKTALDRSIKRALDKADSSRPVITHSGVLPHPSGGTDSHLFFGWYHGSERDLPKALARLPVLARFVGEFGAQAVPSSAGFANPEQWPELDWEGLEAHYGLQRAILDRHVAIDGHDSFERWRDATQAYQANLIRFHVETLRRLKYRPTGGFCLFLLADAQAAISWSVLDHLRVPKAGYHALVAACAPVIIVADRPDALYASGDTVSLQVHVVNDLRMAINGTTTATLRWPGGTRTWRWQGRVAADSVVRVGMLEATLAPPPTGSDDVDDASGEGAIRLDLVLEWTEQDAQAPAGVDDQVEPTAKHCASSSYFASLRHQRSHG